MSDNLHLRVARDCVGHSSSKKARCYKSALPNNWPQSDWPSKLKEITA